MTGLSTYEIKDNPHLITLMRAHPRIVNQAMVHYSLTQCFYIEKQYIKIVISLYLIKNHLENKKVEKMSST